MKDFIRRSIPVAFAFVLLLLTACKPEYTIETIVIPADEKLDFASVKQEIITQLDERLSADFSSEITLSDSPEGIRILTKHRDQPLAEMGQLLGYLKSSELAFYHVYKASELSTTTGLDSIVWSRYKAERNRGLMGETIVAGVEKYGDKDALLTKLNGLKDKPENLRFLLGPNKNVRFNKPTDLHYLIYAIKMPAEGVPEITNKGITEAKATPSAYTGEIEVNISMDEATARTWANMTTEATAKEGYLAIVINDEVISAPRVMSPITGGRTVIAGSFTVEEAQELSRQLLWEPLSEDLEVISQRVVE